MAIYYVVEGREFIPGERKKAEAYAHQLANERGTPVDMIVEHTHITRDPSGFVYDSEVYKRSTKRIKPTHNKTNNPSVSLSTSTDGWIPAHAIRKTPTGEIEILVEKGTLSNPKRMKKILRMVRKLFSAGSRGLRRASRAIENPAHTNLYEVIVGNIGTVYVGQNYTKALRKYGTYVKQSKSGYGRAGGESVVIMRDGDIVKEHEGSYSE